MTEIYREEALASRFVDLEHTAWPMEPRLRLIGIGLVLGAISILGYLQIIPVVSYANVSGTLTRISSSSEVSSYGSASQRSEYILIIEVAPGSVKNIKLGESVSVQLSRDGTSHSGKVKKIAPESFPIADSLHSKTYVYVELDSQRVLTKLLSPPIQLGQALVLRVTLRRDRLRNVMRDSASAP